MAVGPVQLLVIGFENPDFHGEIIEKLEKLRNSDAVRVLDALALYKDAGGEMEIVDLSKRTRDEAIGQGSKIADLIGLAIAGETDMGAGAGMGGQVELQQSAEEDAWDVLEDIPNDSVAGLILLEHRWAIPLRDAIAHTGGFRLADGFISPLDLVEIGVMDAEEARGLGEKVAVGTR
jgi:hypothetical protein